MNAEWLNRPTESGWYWVCYGDDKKIEPAEVRLGDKWHVFYLTGNDQDLLVDDYSEARWLKMQLPSNTDERLSSLEEKIESMQREIEDIDRILGGYRDSL